MNRALVDRREVSATEEREFRKNVFAVAPGVWRMKDIFVNVFILQDRDSPNWILVDAGLKTSAPKIRQMVTDVLGSVGRPSAIIMTHGHFDHRGSLEELAESYGVPVYCHTMERPYLTGQASYPPPDPFVGGGLLASLSFTFPKAPINIEDHLNTLPEDGSVPGMNEWKWIHTPGHTPGHISLFRERDGVLIAGDACVTTQQESVVSVMTQRKVMSGPPKYFTPDWGTSARTVRELAALEPNIIATGHGQTFYGDQARKALHKLAKNFWQLGMPQDGRYVKAPALFDESGPTYIPPVRKETMIRVVAATAMVIAGVVLYRSRHRWLGKKLITTSATLLAAPAAAPAAGVSAIPGLPTLPAL